ncbi:MAG: chemotaxis protein CheW [Actinomycetota bacterium]|nr:chemotaxis protein CheW [Actinomycetota bacterium]MDI7252529.1 chemotaxis protein CheW [Actinomycetota bacterium]
METSTAQLNRSRNPGLNKYLTFVLGDEEYGLDILKVKEIIGLMEITKVPRMPDFVRGVINLRGRIIPVVDLRRKFGMPEQEDTRETCIVVVDLDGTNMGVVVDRVSEVLDLVSEDIEETPEFGASVDTEFITGMGKSGNRVIMLLDIGKVLLGEELASLARLEEPSKPPGME